jgi:foldase protein PrsA
MIVRRPTVAIAIVAALPWGMAACGSRAGTEGTVVRVGPAAITNADVAHWTKVIAPRHAVPDASIYLSCAAREKARAPAATSATLRSQCERQYQTLRRRALDLLISAQWLIGEAADRGMGVSARDAARGLAEKERGLANGAAGLAELLKATAQTRRDVELEIRARLAAARLHEAEAHSERPITQADVASYYREHIRQFRRPERRDFYIVEDLSSEGAARERKREIEHGRDIASFSLHESLIRSSHQLSSPAIVRAIFTSRPGHLVGPIAVSSQTYYLIEVNRIIPAHLQRLAQARSSIERRLAGWRRRRALAAFVQAWARKWTARTDCKPGYVVWRCRQYAGRRPRADAVSLGLGGA